MNSRIFIFCFKSCLKGENDQEYYDVLEVAPRSTDIDAIKKQYKKISLTLHPDKLAQRGIEVTQDHKVRFLKVKEAYDVLTDPKKKQLYDELGSTGLTLMENPAEINPLVLLKNFQRNQKDFCSVIALIVLIFAAILVLPVLFSLKCDNTLGSSVKWVGIWTPMWIVDIFLAVSSISILFETPEASEDGSPPPEVIPLSSKLLNLAFVSQYILLQIFIMIRLDGFTNWDWFSVFAPWFAIEGLTILSNIFSAFFVRIAPPDRNQPLTDLEEGEGGEEELFSKKLQVETEYFQKLMNQISQQKTVLVSLLRVWWAVFLAVQLDGTVHWDWGLVFLPVWTYMLLQYVYAIVFRKWGQEKLAGVDEDMILAGSVKDPVLIAQYQQGKQLVGSSVFTCCVTPFIPLFVAVLLVCRLQTTAAISTFIIILPVFITIGCCCMGVFCGLCCFCLVDTTELEKMSNEGKEGESDVEGKKGLFV